jgi:hypothetical protein
MTPRRAVVTCGTVAVVFVVGPTEQNWPQDANNTIMLVMVVASPPKAGIDGHR